MSDKYLSKPISLYHKSSISLYHTHNTHTKSISEIPITFKKSALKAEYVKMISHTILVYLFLNICKMAILFFIYFCQILFNQFILSFLRHSSFSCRQGDKCDQLIFDFGVIFLFTLQTSDIFKWSIDFVWLNNIGNKRMILNILIHH